MNQSMQQAMWCKATLQYPTVNQLPLESVGDMLNKASNLATTANFQWSYIDKPTDGSIFLVYIANGTPTPPDGFMYMDGEQPYTMNVGGKMIEIWEHKYGFIPGQEQVTSRSRRRFRLGGKNPSDIASSLWLLFYSRTGEETRVQANPMQARPQPIRKYPLPSVTTKPFNLFQAVTGGAQMPNHQQQLQQQYQAQHRQQMQAQQAQAQAAQAAAALQAQQQNQGPQRQHASQTPQQQQHRPGYVPGQVQAVTPQQTFSPYTPSSVPQKRSYQGQAPASAHQQQQQQLPPEVHSRLQRGEVVNESPFDDSNGDEFDAIHPIDISKARFIKHQEWMEQIFSAYPISKIKSPPTHPESMTTESVTAQLEKTRAEIAQLESEHAERVKRFKSPSELQDRLSVALDRLKREPPVDLAALDALNAETSLQVTEYHAGRPTEIRP